MAANIDIAELTNGGIVNGDWEGTGIFDVLISAVNSNIKIQYDNDRIKGSDYANVYMSSMQSVLQASVQFLLEEQVREAEIDKIVDGIATSTKQREVMDSQIALYDRQRESFDDNKYQKLFEAQLNYNGMVFQDAATPDVLDVALEARVNDVFNKITGNDPTLNTMPEV